MSDMTKYFPFFPAAILMRSFSDGSVASDIHAWASIEVYTRPEGEDEDDEMMKMKKRWNESKKKHVKTTIPYCQIQNHICM